MKLILNSIQQVMNSQYSQFCKNYALHPLFGILIPANHLIYCFNFQILKAQLEKMRKAKTFIQAENLMKSFPLIQPTNFKHNDMVILHDMLVVYLNIYLNLCRNSDKKEENPVLSHNFAQPLYDSQSFLGIKLGMTVNAAFNWVVQGCDLETLSELTLKNFQLKWYLTSNPHQEKLFFGASIVGAFYQAKTIKLCFEMKESIELGIMQEQEIIAKMSQCQKNFKSIEAEVRKMYQDLDSDYFFYQLRPLVSGFQNLVFTGVFEDTHEVKGKSSGGTGGYDPSFQMFERVFGIQFSGKLKETQDELLKGMTRWHRKLIQDWGKQTVKTLIRKYCSTKPSLKQAYNNVLQAYASFLGLHSSLIHKFIVLKVPKEHQSNITGTGGTNISQIQGRNVKVLEQKLK